MKDNQDYAIKVLTCLQLQQNPKVLELTNNEINILKKINNQHIIKFIEYF